MTWINSRDPSLGHCITASPRIAQTHISQIFKTGLVCTTINHPGNINWEFEWIKVEPVRGSRPGRLTRGRWSRVKWKNFFFSWAEISDTPRVSPLAGVSDITLYQSERNKLNLILCVGAESPYRHSSSWPRVEPSSWPEQLTSIPWMARICARWFLTFFFINPRALRIMDLWNNEKQK